MSEGEIDAPRRISLYRLALQDATSLLQARTWRPLMDSEILNSNTFELTLDQQFHLEILERQTHNFSREQLEVLLVQTMQMLMLKDNIIQDLLQALTD